MTKKKILSTITSVLLLGTSVCSVFAADTVTNLGTAAESAAVGYMERVSAPVDFDFEIISTGRDSVVAEFTSSGRISTPPYVGEKGTKNTAEKVSRLQYVLEYDKEYSFVYTVTQNGVETVYNSFLTVERGSNIKVVFADIIKNEISDEFTRAAGIKTEIESNNNYSSATRTYDDYDNRGALTTTTDVDWWVVSFRNSGTANFWLGNIPENCDYDIELYASNGTTLLMSSGNYGNTQELLTCPVEAFATYYIKIYSCSGSSTSQYLFRAKNYPTVVAPTIPSNAIGVHVTDTAGNPIENAVVYVYKQKYQSDMYPQYPAVTNENGYAVITGLTTSGPYGVNVIANDYAAKSINEFVETSSIYYEVELENRSSSQFYDPISGFSPAYHWGHGGQDSDIGCTSVCSLFTRICPHEYMNVFVPQNFGWRYDEPSRVEFHQAVDVGVALNTVQYNVFPYAAAVTIAGTVPGCGLTVQLYCEQLDLYATYMHLNSTPLIEGTTVSAGQLIGYSGKSGTNEVHMHFSLAKESLLYAGRTDTGGSIIDWVAEDIALFVDPLAYIN